jgi:hypothetical protein
VGSGVTKRHWVRGRLHVMLGVSSRWGVELTYDVEEPALAFHVLNVWVVFEWWD